MKTILGTGQLGIAIMQLLLERNPEEKILLVNRSGKLDVPVPSNVLVQSADVTSKAAMKAIAGMSDLIFSCTDSPYQQWRCFTRQLQMLWLLHWRKQSQGSFLQTTSIPMGMFPGLK
jgi:pyrroline-5-carboxylate reductase